MRFHHIRADHRFPLRTLSRSFKDRSSPGSCVYDPSIHSSKHVAGYEGPVYNPQSSTTNTNCSTCFPGFTLYYIYLQILHKHLLSQRQLTDYTIYSSRLRVMIHLYEVWKVPQIRQKIGECAKRGAVCRSITITWFRRPILTLAYTKHPNSWPGRPVFHTRCKNKRRHDKFLIYLCTVLRGIPHFLGGPSPHDLDVSGKIGVGPWYECIFRQIVARFHRSDRSDPHFTIYSSSRSFGGRYVDPWHTFTDCGKIEISTRRKNQIPISRSGSFGVDTAVDPWHVRLCEKIPQVGHISYRFHDLYLPG